MSTIEPTEEQRQAARQTRPCGICTGDYGRTCACTYCDDTGRVLDVEATMRIARLLAEREAKLREELHTERTVAEKALAARNDMENERDAARRDLARATGYLLAAQKSEMAMKSQLADATLESRLEAVLSNLDPDGDFDTDGDIEQLHKFVRRVLDAHVAAGEQGAQGEVDALKEECDTLRARISELETSLAESTKRHIVVVGSFEDAARRIISALDRGESLGNSNVESAISRRIAATKEESIKHTLRMVFSLCKVEGINGEIVDADDLIDRIVRPVPDERDEDEWLAWANGTCPEPGCSLANPHEVGVACVKPTAAESPDCPRESPECITVGFHAVDECMQRPSGDAPRECGHPCCGQTCGPREDRKADAPAVSPEMDALLTKALEAVDARAGQSDDEWAKGVAPFIVADLDAKADTPGVVEVDDEHKNGPCGWSGCGRCGDTEGGEG